MKFLLHVSIVLVLNSSLFASDVSLRQMIGQMIMVGFEGTTPQDKWIKQIQIDISKKRIGGVLLLTRNIISPKQLKELTNALILKNLSYPTLIAIDQEGGLISRLSANKGFKRYPSAKKVGKDYTIEQAKKIYLQMANYLKSFGINYNLAPVVDITSSSSNFQKKRTYNKYPSIVSSYALIFLEAFNEQGILTALKHFPGYGSSKTDAHKGEVDITDSWNFDELLPYYDAIQAKSVQSVMVGHSYLKKFDKKYPASLSKNILQGILREEMRYDGVIISDDFFMESIKEYDIKQKIILSINAGVDILLFSDYFALGASTPQVVTKIILEAIQNKKIKKERIIKSYERIIKMKRNIKP